jgi:hypothetical protein
MPMTRQTVIDQLVQILADADTGFNANLAAIATDYGLSDAFEVDWTPGSSNFAEAFVVPDQIDFTEMLPRDDGVCVLAYTSTSVMNQGEELQKPAVFSGRIMAHVDFFLKRKTIRLLRQGGRLPSDASYSLEQLPNAIEDAFLATVNATHAGWWPVSYNGEFMCAREPFRFNGDGWQMRIPFTLLCQIHA